MSDKAKVLEQGKFNKIYCPLCNNLLNIQSKKIADYKIGEADIKVWCRHCQRWIRFSLK